MFKYLKERIAYRRAVREEAAWLIAAQGENALALARIAVAAEGDPELWRFREAVAARVARGFKKTAVVAQMTRPLAEPSEFGRDLAA